MWFKLIKLSGLMGSQDKLGVQAVKIYDNTTMGTMTVTQCAGVTPESCRARVVKTYATGGYEVWAKPLGNGDMAVQMFNKNNEGLPMDIVVALSDIAAFNSSYHGVTAPLFNATFVELFGHMGDHVVHYSEFNVTAEAVPPHGSRLFRLTARPSRWIPNHGTAASSIVSNSSGYYSGNEPWKLNDGVLEFKCGSAGWDATAAEGIKVPPYWVDFDLGASTSIDAFALWNSDSGAWDVSTFDLLTASSITGPWLPITNASGLAAKASAGGGLQVFDGFVATSRYFRWRIDTTTGNQPWVKEVQFRRAKPA